jgi:energy-coupling factor transporter transmembrane protein EcfT
MRVRTTTPAARLLAGVVLLAACATAPLAAPALAFAAGIALLAVFWARPSVAMFAPAFGAGVLGLTTLLVPLLFAGQRATAAQLGARGCLTLTVALAFASTFSVGELAGALSALGVPRPLCAVTSSMLRQLGAVRAQGRSLLLARRLRGATGSAFGADVLAALFERTAERAERAELAARLRGHELVSARRRARIRISDAPLLICVAALALSLHVAPYLA